MKNKIHAIAVLWMAISTSLLAENQPVSLSLMEAEKIALERDLIIQSQLAQKKAMIEMSVSADSWADPEFKIGALAVPVDSFDLQQEQMTQLVIGYKQMLPRGDSAEINSRKWLAKAELVAANKSQRESMLKKMVRKAWLKVYLKEAEQRIIKTNAELFKQLVTVSQSQYVAGRKKRQDVLQAEVEYSLMQDRLEKVQAEKEVSRAALAQWVGDDKSMLALDTSTDFLTELMLSQQQLSGNGLIKHPVLSQRDADVAVAEHDVSLANEKNSTRWGFDITYGMRQGNNPLMAGGGERPDFLSVMAVVSVPVFTSNKQDRDVIASKQLLLAKQYQRQDELRALNSRLQQVKARWYKTIDRIARYEEKVLPQVKQNASAAMSAYQSGVGSFIALTRARVSELTAQLSHIKLTVEKASVLTEIRYLLGEEK